MIIVRMWRYYLKRKRSGVVSIYSQRITEAGDAARHALSNTSESYIALSQIVDASIFRNMI